MTRCQVKIVLLKEKGMKKIEAIIRKTKFEEVKAALLPTSTGSSTMTSTVSDRAVRREYIVAYSIVQM